MYRSARKCRPFHLLSYQLLLKRMQGSYSYVSEQVTIATRDEAHYNDALNLCYFLITFTDKSTRHFFLISFDIVHVSGSEFYF
jgi:hypothetical protein